MKLRGLQHVSCPYSNGDLEAVRHFYGKVLGLQELPVPDTLADSHLIWFAAVNQIELHFFPGLPDQGAKHHFCLDVDDLEEARRNLLDAGHAPFEATAIRNRPRFYCRDPVGNLIEFTSIDGDYL